MSVPRSTIAYTDYSSGDANLVTGCTPVSTGCQNCYARAIYQRFGRDFLHVQTHADKLERLAKWLPRRFVSKREDGQRATHSWRPMCFVCDTGDLFHEAVPFGFIDAAITVMNARTHIDWLILTKRPQRMLQWWQQTNGGYLGGNLWFGVTAEDQEMADERIPLLLRLPASILWVSVEPMLERMELERYMTLVGPSTAGPWRDCLGRRRGGGGIGGQTISTRPSGNIAWIVCGAESGPNRRPFDSGWAADLYEQCQAARVKFFGKQGSALVPGAPLLIHGQVIHEWPDTLDLLPGPVGQVAATGSALVPHLAP